MDNLETERLRLRLRQNHKQISLFDSQAFRDLLASLQSLAVTCSNNQPRRSKMNIQAETITVNGVDYVRSRKRRRPA